MYDIIIIGGGPAGLAAAVYAARKRVSARLISGDIGGQMNRTLGIENYLGYQLIGGAELIEKFQSQVARYPIDQEIGVKVTRVDRVEDAFEVLLETGVRYTSRTVVFAAGKRARELGVAGEAEYAGRGVSYCEICDGPLFAGKRVAVVGGGNSAFEAVLDLVKIAERVSLISLSHITSDPVLAEKARSATNLDYYLEHETVRIEGKDLVERIVIRNAKDGHELSLPVDGVFVEIGLLPNSDAVKHLLTLNDRGEVQVNCLSETSLPGLYAAGDVTSVPEKQIIVAAGEGAKAVLQAHRYLQRLAV